MMGHSVEIPALMFLCHSFDDINNFFKIEISTSIYFKKYFIIYHAFTGLVLTRVTTIYEHGVLWCILHRVYEAKIDT